MEHARATALASPQIVVQRRLGNQVIQQLLSTRRLQPRLKVSVPNDIYEQEADRVADQVMRMSGVATGIDRTATPQIHRLCPQGEQELRRQPLEEEEEPVQAKPLVPGWAIQRQKPKKEEELVEPKGKSDGAPEVTAETEAAINGLPGRGHPLPEALRSFMEPRFNADFSAVRMHTDANAHDLARAVSAQAFTVGANIVFGAGHYAPETESGRHLIAHELTHVVQQANTPQVNPSPIHTTIRRMAACPSTLATDDPVPNGWKPYQGDSSVFHCGFRGILEDRAPTADDLQNECFYDHSGALVTESHPYAGCRGTPNQYDSRFLFGVPHATIDPGGIVRAGAPAFITSRVYHLEQAISSAIQVVSAAGHIVESVFGALGDAIATGVLTAIATVDPGNWHFQGLPARSVRHLNVMGAILGSTSLTQNAETVLSNLTRRLDSFSITGLLEELAQDINQILHARGLAQRVSSATLGELSLLQLVGWLNENSIVQYVRPPEDIAQEQLSAQRAS